MRHLSISLLMFCIMVNSATAKVRLPHVLASDMVLQQQTNVNFWGTASPGTHVYVTASWNKKKVRTVVAADSTWCVSLATPVAGGPYNIVVSDGEETRLTGILIGEVWLCAGQSNMEMPVRGFDRQPNQGCNDVLAQADPAVPVRMFVTDKRNGEWFRQWSTSPCSDVQGEWMDNTPEHVAQTSAVAYYYATYLQHVLHVPVGIIVTTLGGSRIEPWLSREAMIAAGEGDELKTMVKASSSNIWSTPTVLFNAKINPFTPFAVRGFLWYQGESNRINATQYPALQRAMVADWRARWGKADMPFYFVEIAPYSYNDPDATDAAYMREMQQLSMREIPACGMVSLQDAGHPRFIHPTDKQTVGKRLAWLALARTYGKTGFGSASPFYESKEVKDGRVYINVSNAREGLCPMWTPLKGFEIAGEDSIWHPAKAEIETSTCRLAVSSPDVPVPVNVRYCYKNYAEASVFNIYGLPLASFRTDNQLLNMPSLKK